MTDTLKILLTLLLPAALSPPALCAKPKPDPNLIDYQQHLARTSPQPRRGIDSLDVLQLLPEPPYLSPEPPADQNKIELTIEHAVAMALRNSPEIRIVSYEPEIQQQVITQSDAEFDPTLFGELNYQEQDFPNNTRDTSFINPVTEPEISKSETRTFETGIRQKTPWGTEWSMAWNISRKWDNVTSRVLPTRYEPMLTFQLRQPLLRDGWSTVNLARLNISRLNYQAALVQFRQRAEQLAVAVISVYWQLVQNQTELNIQSRLLEMTENTLEKVRARSEIDATAVQIKQTEASLLARRAQLIRAERTIGDARDRLLRLLSDPKLNLLSQGQLFTVSQPNVDEMEFDEQQLLAVAMKNNPRLQQQRLNIMITDINVDVAENQAMPKLDFVANAGVQGFDRDADQAQRGLIDDDFTQYTVGLSFEYPLGNRQRLAELERRKLLQDQAVTELQNAADQVAVTVRDKIRTAQASYLELQAQTAAYEAARINLRALEDTEPIRGKLTPEFLRVKLDAQQSLADAEREQVRARVQFNTALAELAQATGTVLEMTPASLVLNSQPSDFTKPQ